MKAVILCGGKGLRMSDGSGYTCKPLAMVGGRPILWHIMKIYKYYGIYEFILCLGYKGDAIKEYFINSDWKDTDFKLTTTNGVKKIQFLSKPEELSITFIDTGQDTMTGGRIKRIQKYIDDDEFMLTYGDGVADVDLEELLKLHYQKGRIATVTAVRNRSSYGVISVDDGIVSSFHEKPLMDGWINAGFFVLNKKVFDYIEGDDTVFEDEPLRNLVRDNQLAVYKHEGYWQSIDTQKDLQQINQQWEGGHRKWVKW